MMESKMPLQEMYYIAEMVVGVAVIISIVFVALGHAPKHLYDAEDSGLISVDNILIGYMITLITDENFRQFHRRIDNDYDKNE